ncbi:MAG: GDSL-type esterase/lipase family protein [Candidatus Nanopelagicales bacterium]
MTLHVLVLGDSLAFHGPDQPHRPSDPRLYPNRVAASLAEATGKDVRADLVARLGWTARDAWWALTKDPNVWGELLPRADALVLGVGQMDHLPAAVPTWARDAIPYVRPGSVRRRVRDAYRAAAPHVIRATGGRMRQLPQVATDHYLARIVQGVRTYRPGIPVVLIGPSPHNADSYPSHRHHDPAVAAARRWAAEHDAGIVDLDPIVAPTLRDGSGNPDGMHWAWSVHDAIGEAVAGELLARWPGGGPGR